MQPVNVTVITYAPTIFRHCQHCEVAFQGIGLGERIHRDEAKDALPPDLIADFQRVSDWVHELLRRHRTGVAVSVVDAASIEGVWKSLRYSVRRYPAVIVDGHATAVGGELDAADAVIEEQLRGSSPPAAAARGG
jgi:hypothetical protein